MGAGTASHIIAETPQRYAQAIDSARGVPGSDELVRWLESSGVLLKIACLSDDISSHVHAFRTARELVASSRSQISVAAYEEVRDRLVALVKKEPGGGALKDLNHAFEQEVRRSDAVVKALTGISKEARSSGLAAIELSEAHAAVLLRIAEDLGALPPGNRIAQIYARFVSVLPLHDPGWTAIVDMAIKRAQAVKLKHPGLSRQALEQNPAARILIDRAYMSHGKGEMFEHYGRRFQMTVDAANGELHAARQRAAARGPEWTADLTIGELRLGRAGQEVKDWKKFADQGVLIHASAPSGASRNVSPRAVPVDGSAQPGALFQFKAEMEVRESALPGQQAKDLRRMLDDWINGEPVYAAALMRGQDGRIVERVFLLEPPDPKAGLSFFGIGTNQARIAERADLAARGAKVTQLRTDLHNHDFRELWRQIFWRAFDSL